MLDETTKRMFNTDTALEEAWAEIERLRRELDAAEAELDAAQALIEGYRRAQDAKREALAAYAHEAWSGWMNYLFTRSPQQIDGTFSIPYDLGKRWQRQLSTDYADLPEEEKLSDRAEADKILAIIRKEHDDAT